MRLFSLRRRMAWEVVNYRRPYGCHEILKATEHPSSDLDNMELEAALDLLGIILEVGSEYWDHGPDLDMGEVLLLGHELEDLAIKRNCDGAFIASDQWRFARPSKELA